MPDRPLTAEEAKLAGYSGYAQHLPSVPCPRDGDKGVYCATCQGASTNLTWGDIEDQEMWEEHTRERVEAMRASPLRVTRATKEYVRMNNEEMFGNRRWVLDGHGNLVERRGPLRPDETTVIQTVTDGD